MQRPARSVFEGDDMVTALRPIEVRTAAADEVPKVAAVLADAFINDPVFTFLRPGRLRQRARLRTMFVVEMEQYVLANGGTVWTTSGYDGAVAELPPGAWEMPKSARGKETLKWMWAFRTRLPRAIRVQRAMDKRHLREPHFYVRTVGVRTALQGQGVGSMLMQPTLERADSAALPTYIEASSERSAALYERPAASVARHCTSGSASCTWVCLNCQKAARRFGRCVGLRQGLMSVITVEKIGGQGSFLNAGPGKTAEAGLIDETEFGWPLRGPERRDRDEPE
jgi:GNAT superfamily N-acetyltransferase